MVRTHTCTHAHTHTHTHTYTHTHTHAHAHTHVHTHTRTHAHKYTHTHTHTHTHAHVHTHTHTQADKREDYVRERDHTTGGKDCKNEGGKKRRVRHQEAGTYTLRRYAIQHDSHCDYVLFLRTGRSVTGIAEHDP